MQIEIRTTTNALNRALQKVADLHSIGVQGQMLAFYPATLGEENGGAAFGGLLRIEDDTGRGYDCGWISGHLGFGHSVLHIDTDRVPAALWRDLLEELQ